MPTSLWFAAITAIFSLIAFATWRANRKRDTLESEDFATGGKVATFVLAPITLALIFMSCLTIVPANQVAVITVFGSWSGTATEGIHFVNPLSEVDTFPTRNQKSIRDQADGNDNCIPVKLDGGAGACVDATVLYTIDENHAEVLWRGWGSFAKLNTDLINRSTDDAAGQVYGGYTAENATSGRNRQAITDAISDRLRGKLDGSGVRLESVTLGDIHLPPDVQARINAILEQDAKTEIAKKREEAAKAEARANAALQQSLTPEALMKLCIDAAKEIKPQVFNCLGGSQNPPVILNSK